MSNHNNGIDCDHPANPTEQLECLLAPQEELIEGSRNAQEHAVHLPSGKIDTDFMPFFINTGLSIMGTLIFVALLYAGFLMIFSQDNEESINKGKKILINIVVGAAVAAIAYAVIYGVANLDLD